MNHTFQLLSTHHSPPNLRLTSQQLLSTRTYHGHASRRSNQLQQKLEKLSRSIHHLICEGSMTCGRLADMELQKNLYTKSTMIQSLDN